MQIYEKVSGEADINCILWISKWISGGGCLNGKSVGEHLSVTMTLKFAKCPVLLLSGIKESVL